MGLSGEILVSDDVQDEVYKKRANHHPANAPLEMDQLEHLIGVAVFKNMLYCAEYTWISVAFKDSARDAVVNEHKLAQCREAQREAEGMKTAKGSQTNIFKRNSEKHSHFTQFGPLENLSILDLALSGGKGLNDTSASKGNPAKQKSSGRSPLLKIDFDREIKQTVGLWFDREGQNIMYIPTFTGAVHVGQFSLQGTPSSVVMEEERRILNSLRDRSPRPFKSKPYHQI